MRIDQKGDHARVWNQFAQNFESLWCERVVEQIDSGAVAAGPVDALDQPVLDRIAAGRKNNRNCYGCGLCHLRSPGAASCHKHRYLPLNQFGRKRGQTVILSVAKAEFDRQISTFDIAVWASPSRKAARVRVSLSVSDDLTLSQPIVRIVVCCALAARGHDAAAPPRTPRNSRRFMQASEAQQTAS